MNDEELICNSVKTGGCTRGKKKNLHKTSGKKKQKTNYCCTYLHQKERGKKAANTPVLTHRYTFTQCVNKSMHSDSARSYFLSIATTGRDQNAVVAHLHLSHPSTQKH